MALGTNKGQGGQNDGRQAKQTRNGLIWPHAAVDFDGSCAGLVGVCAVDVKEFHNEAVLPRIDAEAEFFHRAGRHPTQRRRKSVVGAPVSRFGLAVGQGGVVRAIGRADHEHHQFGVRGRRLVDGDVHANRDVGDVVAGDGHAPNEAHILGGLSPSNGRLIVGGKRHREERKSEQNHGDAEEHEHVPA